MARLGAAHAGGACRRRGPPRFKGPPLEMGVRGGMAPGTVLCWWNDLSGRKALLAKLLIDYSSVASQEPPGLDLGNQPAPPPPSDTIANRHAVRTVQQTLRPLIDVPV